jgi:cytochrome c-type biogenesis protein CcmH/NrfG
MRRLAIALVVIFASGCSMMRGAGQAPQQAQMPLPDHYVVFFQPRTSELAEEAQVIVRQAALAAQQRKASRIEIAVPAAVPGGPNVVESRYTAIQNIISAAGAGTNPGLYSRVVLSTDAVALPGGTDRAEIRLVP